MPLIVSAGNPVRLDPWQNIVNVSWGRKVAVLTIDDSNLFGVGGIPGVQLVQPPRVTVVGIHGDNFGPSIITKSSDPPTAQDEGIDHEMTKYLSYAGRHVFPGSPPNAYRDMYTIGLTKIRADFPELDVNSLSIMQSRGEGGAPPTSQVLRYRAWSVGGSGFYSLSGGGPGVGGG